ncbi:MAG TPA: hypothetical protein GXX14_10045 [Clostridiaceae bacterium]|nr:hypothetical protein [Clostridiaceae bacterium]
MKMRFIISLILVGVLAFGAGLGTLAWFTSQSTNDNVFQTGTLIIGASNPGSNTGVFNDILWYPGREETKTITVVNHGNLPFKYRLKLVLPDGRPLGVDSEGENIDGLEGENLDGVEGANLDGVEGVEGVEGTDGFGGGFPPFPPQGNDLEDQFLLTIKKGSQKIFDDELGKFPGSGIVISNNLAPSTSENLSVTVRMKTSAGNKFQNKQLNVKFVFDATQINNPGWNE